MKTNKLMIWIAGAFVLAVVAVGIGKTAGTSIADKAVARLQLVWPSIMDFPERDRAFLAGLSMTCRLHEKPMEPAAVVACLHDAAADPNGLLPRDEVQADAADRLERLLALASPGK